MDALFTKYSAYIIAALSGALAVMWRFMNVMKELALLNQRVTSLENDLVKTNESVQKQMDRIEDKIDKIRDK